MANPTAPAAAGPDLPIEYFVKQHDSGNTAPPPPEPSPEDQAKVDAELKKLSDAIPNILWGDAPPKPPADPEPPKAPAPPAPAPEPPKVVAPPAPAADDVTGGDEPPAPTVRRAPSKSGLSATDLAADIAARTGQAVKDALQPLVSAPSTRPDPDADFINALSPEDQESLEGVKLVESEFPDKFKGAYQRQVRFMKQLDDYRRRWEHSNPGQQWDPEDDAHSAVFKNQPEIPASAIDRARIRQEAKVLVEEREKQFHAELAQVRSEAVAAKIQPEIEKRAAAVVPQFVELLDDSVKILLKEKGPAGLKESDPDTYAVLDAAVNEVQQYTAELHALVAGAKKYDHNNALHAQLTDKITNFEAAMMELPANKRSRGGRQFAARDAYDAMTDAQRSRYWVLGEAEVVQMLVRQAANAAKAQLAADEARFERRVKARGLASAPAKSAAPATPPPAGGDGGPIPPTTSKAGEAAQTIEERLKQSLWS